MDETRQNMFNEYITYLYSTGSRKYDIIAYYIKSVKNFLEKTESVNRRGYNRYKKNHSAELINERYAKDAICDFLNFRGIGYGKCRKSTSYSPLEKLAVISEKNRKIMNEFIHYLTEEEDYSPHTLKIYMDSIRQYFEYANEVSVDNYRRFFKTLESKGLKPATIRLRMTSLERLSKWLGKPVQIKRPKFPKKLDTDNVPTEQEYNKLLKYLESKTNKDYYFFIKILGTTGARLSEFLQFTWEDVISGEVTLKGKGSKYRRFFFTKDLQKEAQRYCSSCNKTGIVAVGKFGPISSRTLGMAMKEWGDKCGIERKKMHPHAFRHFFAKMFLKKTNDVIQLADLLGHGSVDTTRIYLQKSYEEQEKEYNRCVTW
jgi:site-specific recombinase XerC